jgi:four helix bundle protein
MLAKLAIVEEEADESVYWLELLVDANVVTAKKVEALIAEGRELVAMTVASIKTLRRQEKIQNPKSKIQNLKFR